MLAIPARVIATSFAILCFVCTLTFGMYNGNSWTSVMFGAIAAGGIAWLVGTIVGGLILRTVNDHIARHRADNPIPDENQELESDPPAAAAG